MMKTNKMVNMLAAILAAVAVLAAAGSAIAWEQNGAIPGTDVEYSGLTVTKRGVSVKLTNRDGSAVKVSLRLTFYDRSGNTLGYSLFGLREIPSGNSAEYTNNYLTGSWKPCRDAARAEWQRLTYEIQY